jgi:hypothetical protein
MPELKAEGEETKLLTIAETIASLNLKSVVQYIQNGFGKRVQRLLLVNWNLYIIL